MYGLLGGQWFPNATGEFTMNVYISSENERFFEGCLGCGNDEVRVGLPAQYAKGVMDGMDLAKTELKNAFASGNLLINCAAHGNIGSCEAVFKHLTAILIKLFNTVGNDPTDEDLIKLLPSRFD